MKKQTIIFFLSMYSMHIVAMNQEKNTERPLVSNEQILQLYQEKIDRLERVNTELNEKYNALHEQYTSQTVYISYNAIQTLGNNLYQSADNY
ncbi:MAG TPA: hypothetical protein VGW78_02265 [Candidatus Babeliales bacterium]|jgi:hypothetical protein|nr:hypothetical protein [Candidatus Babeliales bacterium]